MPFGESTLVLILLKSEESFLRWRPAAISGRAAVKDVRSDKKSHMKRDGI